MKIIHKIAQFQSTREPHKCKCRSSNELAYICIPAKAKSFKLVYCLNVKRSGALVTIATLSYAADTPLSTQF